MMISLVSGECKEFKVDLAISCICFSSGKNFYRTCKEIALDNIELRVCNKRVYADITDIKSIEGIIDFIKCIKFFNKTLKELFIECTPIQKMYLLDVLKVDKEIICCSEGYKVFYR